MTTMLDRRLSALEARRVVTPFVPSPEEIEAAARLYAASLDDPGEPDPPAVAYWASAGSVQLAADLDTMLKGAPAPWE